MPNTHTLTLDELREFQLEYTSELPQWMHDWYSYYGPELYVEVQEGREFEQPTITQ
jgi:hypothetical protein